MKYIVETDDGMGVGILGGCVGFGTPDIISDKRNAQIICDYCNKTFKRWHFIIREVAA